MLTAQAVVQAEMAAVRAAYEAGITTDDVHVLQYNNKEVRIWGGDEVHCGDRCEFVNDPQDETQVLQAILVATKD